MSFCGEAATENERRKYASRLCFYTSVFTYNVGFYFPLSLTEFTTVAAVQNEILRSKF